MIGVIIAESIGFLVLIFVCAVQVVLSYAYVVNGVAFLVLIPVSFIVYATVSIIQYVVPFSKKTRWILYAAKLAFIIALLLLTPVIADPVGEFAANKINGFLAKILEQVYG